MSFIKGLKCRECGRGYPADVLFICEYCFGSVEVIYDYEKIKEILNKEVIKSREKNIWRYKELLPLDKEPIVGFHTGFTPLIKANNLAKELGVKDLYIKDDSVNHPTLSFKDRLVSLAISRAVEFGFKTVACASTGNLANSVAALSAQAKLRSFIFIPADLELGKVIGTLIYKPNLIKVLGNYDQVNRLCTEIAQKYKWAFVNVNIRPYYSEGSKTYIFEIIEQLGWRTPKHIIVPVGGASLISKIWKGLKELKQIGLIDRVDTKIYAAQAKGSNPVVSAIKEKSEIIKPQKPDTIAKSIAIGNPADGYYALDVVRESGGWGEDVTDSEIIEGIKILARCEGIFTETAGGVVVAVAKKLLNKKIIPKDEEIVLSITGQGLKTQEVVAGHLEDAITIEPNIKAFEEVYKW